MFTTDRRPQFQLVLEEIIAINDRVFFQPPSNMINTLEYPCIVYDLAPGWTAFADNRPFIYTQQYEVTLIGREPQPDKFHKLAFLPESVHSRSFVADNLRHDVFNIYF